MGFTADKKKTSKASCGFNTRYFLIEGGDKVYYFKEKPNGYDASPLEADWEINLGSADGWFQLPKSNPNDDTNIRLSKGNSKTLVIQASHCKKERGSLEFRLAFKKNEKAKECLEKLRARCPKALDRHRRPSSRAPPPAAAARGGRRLMASELLARWKRHPTSAEVVLGPLEEIESLQ